MAFWKKSEDPWDIDPKKKRRERPTFEVQSTSGEEDAPESLLDELKGMFRKKPEEETPVIPEKCPWCGSEMERGFLDAVKGGDIWWCVKKPGWKADFLGQDANTSWLVTDEGGFHPCKTAWYCPNCRKMTLDCAEMRRPHAMDFPAASGEPQNTENEET